MAFFFLFFSLSFSPIGYLTYPHEWEVPHIRDCVDARGASATHAPTNFANVKAWQARGYFFFTDAQVLDRVDKILGNGVW